jgi:hypothetical protein
MSEWVGVIGTLGGALAGGIVGASGTWMSDRARWRRERVTQWDTDKRQLAGAVVASMDELVPRTSAWVEWRTALGSNPGVENGERLDELSEEIVELCNRADQRLAEVAMIGGEALTEPLGDYGTIVLSARQVLQMEWGAELGELWIIAEESLPSTRQGFVTAIRAELLGTLVTKS